MSLIWLFYLANSKALWISLGETSQVSKTWEVWELNRKIRWKKATFAVCQTAKVFVFWSLRKTYRVMRGR